MVQGIDFEFFSKLLKKKSLKAYETSLQELSLIFYSKSLKDPLGDRLRSDGGYSLTSIESDFESPEIV